MTISTIEESEIEESFSIFTLYHVQTAGNATGQTVISAAGHHPKCRLVRAHYTTLAYATGASVWAIERGSGEDIATATGNATVGNSAAFTIAPAAGTKNSIERNEDIAVNLTTQGSTTNAGIILMTFENIH